MPKSANNTVSAIIDDFRTITVCPIILKIFKHCVLQKIEPLLKSSARQFGFKKDTIGVDMLPISLNRLLITLPLGNGMYV